MGHSYTIVNGVLINYYEILKVERNVTPEAIKKAYYIQAKIWHPDRNPEKKAETEKQFKLIAEAYEILSHSFQRSQYDIDLQNYERVSGSRRSTFTGKTEANFSPSSQRSTSGTFNFGKTEFTSKPETPKPAPNNKNPKNPPRNSQSSSNGTSNPPKPKPTKPSKVTHKLQVSLEELYIGTQKKLRITRSFLSGMQTQDVLVIDITTGWCENRKIELKGKGDEYAPRAFQDITFELVPKPHSKFKLIGEELELEVKLSIVESLCGFTRDLPHFAGQVVSYTTPKCTGQGYVTRIPEGGMPHSDDPTKFRDLILRFSVHLPEELTPFQVQAIQSLF